MTSKETETTRKVLGSLIDGNIKDAVIYVVEDVFFPAIRDMIFQTSEEFLKRIIYGKKAKYYSNNTSRYYGQYVGHGAESKGPVAYNKMYTGAGPIVENVISLKKDIPKLLLFKSEEDAKYVLNVMRSKIESKGIVSVEDYYNIVNHKSHDSIRDKKFVWTDLESATVERHPSGNYMIEFPEPEFL